MIMKKSLSCFGVLLLVAANIITIFPLTFFSSLNVETIIQSNDEKEGKKSSGENLYYIQLEGTPEQIGRTHGLRFQDQICTEVRNWWKNALDQGFSRENILKEVSRKEQALETYAPHILHRIRATAEACDLPYEDLVALTLFSDSAMGEEEGCTSWVACGSATERGKTLLHKNRDHGRSTQAIYRFDEAGKYAFVAVGTMSTTSVSAGINEYGLAVVSNSVFTTDVNLSGASNTVLNQLILENCQSVDEVFDYLDTIEVEGGTIEFVADKDKCAIIELTAHHRSSESESIISENFDVRANTYLVLGGVGGEATEDSQDRFDAANDFLTVRNGSITLADCNELSRHHRIRADGTASKNDGSICNRPVDGKDGLSTCLGVTFEINETYPGNLSTMWVALGLPDSSIYAPFHVSATEVSEAFANGTIWGVVEEIRYNNLGPYSAWTQELLEWEANIIEEEKAKEIEAGSYLPGDPTSAQEILTEFDLAKGEWIYEKLSNISKSGFWRDSFYDETGIDSKNNIESEDGNITLTGSPGLYALSGTLKSMKIKQDKGWTNAIFHATHVLPPATNIVYKIVSADSDEVLCQVTPEQAASGYNLSACVDVEEIRLVAELSSPDQVASPVLLDWTITGLAPLQETSWFWTYGIWYVVGGAALSGVIAFLIYRRRKLRSKKHL